MAKVTRKKVTRGVELTPDRVFDPISGMSQELSTSNIELEQTQGRYTTFRLNWSIPWIDNKYFFDNASIDPEDSSADCNAPMYIPFCLPPLQDDFDEDKPALGFEQPFPILDEIGLSFDQTDEATTLVSQWYGKRVGELDGDLKAGASNGYQHRFPSPSETSPEFFAWCPHTGKKSYERLDAYEFRVEVYEKPQAYWSAGDDWGDLAKERNQVISAAFPAANYAGLSTRLNPVSFTGLNKQLSPYKTYLMAIYAPQLHDADTVRRMHAIVPSLNVSMRFLTRPYSRDTNAGDSEIQNMPTVHKGAKGSKSTITTIPVAGDNITADADAKGISTNLQAIDQRFTDKLRGGYQDFSMAYPSEELAQDAGYDVITVPLGQGFNFGRMSVRDDFPWAPYAQTMNTVSPRKTIADYPATETAYVDRRLIPITHPMTIHHVLFVLNYTSDRLQHPGFSLATAGVPPPDPTPLIGPTQYINATLPQQGKLMYKVGVGVLTGAPGDNLDYEQVAYMERESNTTAGAFNSTDAQIVDSISLELPGCGFTSATSPSTTRAAFEQQILSVPLVDVAGLAAGKGYYSDVSVAAAAAGTRGDQGPPYFVGEGNTYTADRSNVAHADSATGRTLSVPRTGGAEQYLEVRLAVEPQNNIMDKTLVGGNLFLTYNEADFGWGDIALGYGGCWVYIIGKKHLT